MHNVDSPHTRTRCGTCLFGYEALPVALECLAQLASMRRLPISITDIRPGFVATDLIAGSHFPLQLSAEHVAADIVNAVERGRKVVTIDWRYRLLVVAWRMIPRWAWIRLRFVK